jgi:lysophospholipase L1-like esterase
LPRLGRPGDGTGPVTEYSSTLTAIVQRLHDRTTARFALRSLPPAGDEPTAATNAEVERYDRAIADVAARTRASYLPLYEQLLPLLAPGHADPGDLGPAGMPTVAFQHYALGRSWDQIAESSGRWLLTDGIHLTDRAGAGVTDIVTEWLETSGPRTDGPQQ